MLVMVVIGYWVTTVLVCTFVAFIFFFQGLPQQTPALSSGVKSCTNARALCAVFLDRKNLKVQ